MTRRAEQECPICRKPLTRERSDAERDAAPFCSARCRAIDLGRWLSETYRIAGPSVEQDDPGELQRQEQRESLEEDFDA